MVGKSPTRGNCRRREVFEVNYRSFIIVREPGKRRVAFLALNLERAAAEAKAAKVKNPKVSHEKQTDEIL